MTYVVGGTIQAADLNGFITNNTANVNIMWGTGTNDRGYGQTAITTATAVGDTVNRTPWDTLVNTIASAAAHQGSTITARTAPATGDTVAILAALNTDIGTINTNRMNAAAQGGTNTTTATTTGTWSNRASFTLTAQFGSHNQARYYFNCGGQLGISMAHTATNNINGLINRICGDLGTVWLSSGTCTLAGTNYTGTTQIGGGGTSTITTGTSFYAAGNMATVLDTVAYNGGGWPTTTVNYTTGTNITASVTNNGSGTLTFTVVLDEVPNGAIVAAGTSATLTSRVPETTNIADSWGTITLSSSVAVT